VGTKTVRAKLIAIYGLLLAANCLAWIWALIAFGRSPLLLGLALLAYGLGIRHAFDADHIAAIDNVTRKLMHEGKRPVCVGLFFALGHSTVVLLLGLLVALTTPLVAARYFGFADLGGVIGTSISSAFLFAVATANIVVGILVYRAMRALRSGATLARQDFERGVASGGLLSRIFRSVFRLATHSWHMFPIGILFGLGFDTATEIGLLGISASQASNDMSVWPVLIFPALFTAGMCVVDTTDGVLMLGAYSWACTQPMRKLRYNLAITSASVVLALVVGGAEIAGLVGDWLGVSGSIWTTIGSLQNHVTGFAVAITAFFIGSWAISYAIHRSATAGQKRFR